MAPDPKEEQGTLYLRLRHAVVNDGIQLIELTPRATGLSHLAAHRLHHRPGEAAAVAAALVGGDIDAGPDGEIGGVSAEALAAAAAALADRADQPITVILGRPSLAEAAGPTMEAAAEFHHAANYPVARILGEGLYLRNLAFLPALHRGNVFGALDMGLAAGLLPGRVTLADGGAALAESWGSVPASSGTDARGILKAVADGNIDVLILLGADPLGDFPDRELAETALGRASTVIASDLFLHPSAAQADIVLPAAGFGERRGTHTNMEGRITRERQVVTSPGTARADWAIASELARLLDADFGFGSPEEVWEEIIRVAPSHRDLSLEAIDAETDGVVAAASSIGFTPPESATVVPHVDAYSLRLVSARRMYDRGTLVQHAPSLSGLAPGAVLGLNPSDFQRVGVDPGTEVQVISPVGEMDMPVVADPGVPRGTAVFGYNHPDLDVRGLIDPEAVVTDVRIQTR